MSSENDPKDKQRGSQKPSGDRGGGRTIKTTEQEDPLRRKKKERKDKTRQKPARMPGDR